MSKGLLVPDELVLELFQQRLSQPDAKNGAIFDGYPRTVAQAEALDQLLAAARPQGRLVVASIEVALPEMIERIVLRRTCEVVDRFTTCATIRRPRRSVAAAAVSSFSATTTPKKWCASATRSTWPRQRRCSSTTRRARCWSEVVNGVGEARRSDERA